MLGVYQSINHLAQRIQGGQGRLDTLAVPIATDQDGALVYPDKAIRGSRYYCPGCGDPVILRAGPKVRQHFAHKASTTCSSESIIHRLAKRLIVQHVEESIKGGPAPVIVRCCAVCGASKEQHLPDRIDGVVEEFHLPTGHVSDVALLDGQSVAAIVEVRVTHEVGEEKAIGLKVPFVELAGEAVVRRPGRWEPLAERLRPLRCHLCEKALLEFGERLRRISQRTNTPLPTSYYRAAPMECWRCHEEILVFAWPRGILGESRPERSPVPRTIQRRYSRTMGSSYWANTCPHCKAMIGDHFVHSEPAAPFFGIYCEDDSDNSYITDMWRLAVLQEKPDKAPGEPHDPAVFSQWVRRLLFSAGSSGSSA